MQVERAETVPYAIPFTEPYATARGTIERREMVLVRLHTDSGPIGLGEAVPMSLRGDRSLAEVDKRLSEAAARTVGLDLAGAAEDPLAFAIATVVELSNPRRLGPAATAALECAIFDLVAKATDQPLWKLLGASAGEAVRCNATLVAGSPDAVAGQAVSWQAEGFETFKLKLGASESDEATVAAVREAIGAEARIRIDANEAWKPRDAIAALEAVERHNIELAEQPTSGLRGMAKVSSAVPIPLAADESVASVADAHRALQRRACEFATAKLAKVGGIGAARQIARVIPTYLSSALDGPVGIAAAAHTAQLLREDGTDPGVAHGLATQRLFEDSPASVECSLESGSLILPPGPGLGVEIHEGALAELALD